MLRMKYAWLLWAAVAGPVVWGAGYEVKEKVEPVPVVEQGVPAEGALPGTPPGGYAADGRYPYYANTPEDMIPFRNVEAHQRYWLTRLPFRGPGAEYPDPEGLKSLKIGLLSPAAYGPEGARGARTRQGILLAFEEENARRGAGALPFEIYEREDAPQWGSAANIAVDFADHEVLGFLGTIDGDATHVALRVALKIETYMINTSDPDPTLTETQIPWLTRVFPDDRQQGIRLAEIVVKQRGCKRIAVFRESSRPGRVGVMHFMNSIRRLGVPAVQHVFFKPGDTDIRAQLQAIQGSQPDAVVFYGQPEDVGRFVKMFREAGVQASFFGFDRLKEDGFREAAGPHAEGMTICYFFNPSRTDAPWLEFVGRFETRWGHRPDIYAAYGYDGARLMIEAVNRAGPNRYRIRDYLANLDEWEGVTGPMIFDARWDNIVPISVARFQGGRWQFEAPTILKREAKNRVATEVTTGAEGGAVPPEGK